MLEDMRMKIMARINKNEDYKEEKKKWNKTISKKL